MRTFQDRTGRPWTIDLHVTAIRQIKGVLGIDLYALVDNGFEGLTKLMSDPIELVNLLYFLCLEQAAERNVSDDDFGRVLAGETLEAAGAAFYDEYVDFFPNARTRQILRMLRDAGGEASREAFEKAMGVIEGMLGSSGAGASNGPSGDAPESSGSTPDPSPSDSST